MSTTQFVIEIGPCKICNALVEVTIRRDGGIPVAFDNYTGLDDNGDHYVCRDHYCPVCGGAHASEAQFDLCAFQGTDLTPLCSINAALAALGASA